MSKKRKTRREKSKYPALEPELNIKKRWEEIWDVNQYSHKLDDKDKEWLNKFMSEYVCDHLDRKNLKNNLHNTLELKKSCDDRNNSRERDIFTATKAIGVLNYLEDNKSKEARFDIEDDLIEKIDKEN